MVHVLTGTELHKGQHMNTPTSRLGRGPQALRGALLSSIDSLYRRRASEIPDGYIDGYVALNWMEWHGGGLRLTVVGENIRRQLTGEAS
jgi:hypothetical protein